MTFRKLPSEKVKVGGASQWLGTRTFIVASLAGESSIKLDQSTRTSVAPLVRIEASNVDDATN